MLSKVRTATHIGYDNYLIDIECDSTNALPGITIVGLPAKSVDEAKDRIKSAIRNSSLEFPAKKFTLNLAPADVPKHGTGFDLAIAVAVLSCTGQIDQKTLKNSYFFGELSLDGTIRPIKGILGRVSKVMRDNPAADIYLAHDNANEASLITGAKIYPAPNLKSIYKHLIKESPLNIHTPPKIKRKRSHEIDFTDIAGQDHAKRALEIAAAGGHNVLMNGPPGSGKTMLAKALTGILPRLTTDEIIETTMLHSIAGQNNHEIVTSRPFRSPHHTSSTVSLVGGGRFPSPGEISLSHHGVLFLDELPEYTRHALESLRQPLEDKYVVVSRSESKSRFPANFMLVATQNPCPCGFATDPKRTCRCSAADINRYSKKVSGPLMDRIDLTLEVGPIDNKKLLDKSHASESTAEVAKRVELARDIQRQRNPGSSLNSDLSNKQIKTICKISDQSKTLLDQSSQTLNLSARSIIKLLRVARTIADLNNRNSISTQDIQEALQYRRRHATLYS